ncbi:MAG: hypothetical protein JRG91_02960 [Deltaproteobacteria bacterium]|nr:hypothetical protein [Deltaproteobacteria bacterium]
MPTTSSTGLVAGLLAALALSTRVVCAAPESEGEEPTDPEIAQAQDHFEQGLAAYQDEKYAQALVHFLDSYDLNPLDELLYNIGYCYEQIGQEKKAIEYYERYLATLPEDEEKERAKVMAKLEEIKGEEEEEGKGESKKKKWKKRVSGKYSGDWMHGLFLALAYDMNPVSPREARYPVGKRTGIGFRVGYNLRLLERKLVLAAEFGYLQVGYVDEHTYNVALDLSAGYRLPPLAGGGVQLVIAGMIDLKWYASTTALDPGDNFFSLGVGPEVRLYWHWSEKVGLYAAVGGIFGWVPKWSGRPPIHGYVMFKIGVFFGLA